MKCLLPLLLLLGCSSAQPTVPAGRPSSVDGPIYLKCAGGQVIVPTDPERPSIAVVARGAKTAFSSRILGIELPDFLAPQSIESADLVCAVIHGTGATTADLAASLRAVLRWQIVLAQDFSAQRILPGTWQAAVPGTARLNLENGTLLLLRFDPTAKQIRFEVGRPN